MIRLRNASQRDIYNNEFLRGLLSLEGNFVPCGAMYRQGAKFVGWVSPNGKAFGTVATQISILGGVGRWGGGIGVCRCLVRLVWGLGACVGVVPQADGVAVVAYAVEVRAVL